MSVGEAQNILVFPFRLESTLRVGEVDMHDIYVFNIGNSPEGQTFDEFGGYLLPETDDDVWNDGVDTKYSNNSVWAELDSPSATGSQICTNTNVDFDSLDTNCKVKNDRTFKKYRVKFSAENNVSRIDPYDYSIRVKTTDNEEVNINFKLTITAGETDASTSTIAPADLNNTELVVGSTLVVQVFGKDKLGGPRED